jgi:hypothetical protein
MRAASLARLMIPSLLLSSCLAPTAEPLILEDARLVPLDDPPDQSIRARMRATQFNGTDRWFGLIGRYVDSQNYYVSLRNSNSISLRKLTNGAITVLDTATLNGRLVLEATDTMAPHATGRYGLGNFKTAAEADDFLAVQPQGVASARGVRRPVDGKTGCQGQWITFKHAAPSSRAHRINGGSHESSLTEPRSERTVARRAMFWLGIQKDKACAS